MYISLIPSLLPVDRLTSFSAVERTFTPGMRLVAIVLASASAGQSRLALGDRDVLTASPLPYPAGTRLTLDVVRGGAAPELRIVADSAEDDAHAAGTDQPTPSTVASASYGMATAILAAREAPALPAAARALLRWLPALVARGSMTDGQAQVLSRALSPIQIGPGSDGGWPDAEALALALAQRVGEGGLLLERQLADLVRHHVPRGKHIAAANVRTRLAALADALAAFGDDLSEVRAAVATLQAALLGEQARVAAHLAHDGVLDVSLALRLASDGEDLPLRLRIARDAPRPSDDQPAAVGWQNVRLDLAFEGLGAVQVQIGVGGGHLRAEFVVAQSSVADAIEARAGEFGYVLGEAGFSHVLTRVVVDPVRVSAPDALPDLPADGSIVNLQA